MAITKLTNTQIQTLVNSAYKQMTGKETMTTEDLSAFSDSGNSDLTALRETFTGKLLATVAKNWYTDSSYRSSYRDVFFEDASRFGAITQAISVSVPEVKENSAWKGFQSGTSTIGQYTVYLPVVDSKYYVKSESWALPITITGEQWDTAFRSETDLYDFVGYIFMCVDNALVQHMEDLNNANRNHFLAEKINASNNSVPGIHVVDLVSAYVADAGISTDFSVAQFLNSENALRYAIEQIGLYIGYMKKQTALFNTEGKVRFVPEERLVVQLLGFFTKRLDTVARSQTFHNDLVALPLYDEVPAWQNMNSLSFDNLSKINIKLSNTVTVEQSGIVGLICDKWAIVHTQKSQRVATQRFDIEDLTLYEYQYRDQYMNNLTMNAVVFLLKDHTAATV